MAPFAWLLLAFPFSLADSCESDCGATAPVDLLQRKLQVNNSLSLEGTRPNLLFIVLDQWRWDWTGLDAETPVPMPTLKRLAAQGVRFTRAYTPSPQCVPARSALAQVREYKDSWVKNNSELMTKQVSPNLTTTFMSALQDVGYTTMMAGKDHLFYNMYPMVPENEERESMQAIGFEHYHRTTDKYHFCLSDIGEDLGVLEDLGMSLEDLGMSNESFDGTGKGLLFPMDGYGVSLNETEGLFEKQCLYYGSVGYPDQQREGFSCGGTPVYDLLSITENGFRCQVSNPLDEDWSPDAWVRRKAVKLLQQHKHHGGSKPWFLQVNFLSPHPPFIVKPSSEQLMQELDGKLPPAIDDEKTTMLVFDDGGAKLLPYNKTYVNTSASRLQYAALLYQLDGEIKEILEAVSEMGAMDNTIVVVTGDHGEHLGDHGHFGKTSPFEAAAHVPLIVAGEGLPLKGVEEHRPVSLIDIPATFLDLAGAPLAPGMQGYSFLPALNGGAVTRPAVMFGIYYWETPFLAAGYTPGVIQFDAAAALFGDSFLKLICCPRGCRKAGTLLPSTMYGSPTVALMNVTAGTGKHQFEHDILNQPPGHGVAEALYLATFLADEFRQVCEPLLAPKA